VALKFLEAFNWVLRIHDTALSWLPAGSFGVDAVVAGGGRDWAGEMSEKFLRDPISKSCPYFLPQPPIHTPAEPRKIASNECKINPRLLFSTAMQRSIEWFPWLP
jgi:hypothetical protein